jgi:hypothetical protein
MDITKGTDLVAATTPFIDRYVSGLIKHPKRAIAKAIAGMFKVMETSIAEVRTNDAILVEGITAAPVADGKGITSRGIVIDCITAMEQAIVEKDADCTLINSLFCNALMGNCKDSSTKRGVTPTEICATLHNLAQTSLEDGYLIEVTKSDDEDTDHCLEINNGTFYQGVVKGWTLDVKDNYRVVLRCSIFRGRVLDTHHRRFDNVMLYADQLSEKTLVTICNNAMQNPQFVAKLAYREPRVLIEVKRLMDADALAKSDVNYRGQAWNKAMWHANYGLISINSLKQTPSQVLQAQTYKFGAK